MIRSMLFLTCVLFSVVVVASVAPSDFPKCTRTWKKYGCYNDKVFQRALPVQVVNNRDLYSHVYRDPLLDWARIPESFHSLACQCAEMVWTRGYKVFGLQFYGECWSGADGLDTFNVFDFAPDKNCVMGTETIGELATCDNSSEHECIGVGNTNFVYILGLDGGFTPWMPDGDCTAICGGGVQRFVRSCTSPTPRHGGKDCEGPTEKTESCNEFECPIPCTRAIDLGIILDATQSVGRKHFKISKHFVRMLGYSMTVSAAATHIGLISYHLYPTMELWFNELMKQDPSIISQVLNNITYLGPRTFTDKAIGLAGSALFTEEGGDRLNIPDVLLVITDGRTNRASEPYRNVLLPLERKGVTTIPVGVGKGIQYDELNKIAMGKAENVFHVSQFEELYTKLQAVVNRSCEIAASHTCSVGWNAFENHCYLVSNSTKTRFEAQAYCHSQGGDLVKITSANENDFILNLARNVYSSLVQVWIGLRLHAGEGQYLWSDDSPPDYTNWAPNMPVNNAFKQCGSMWINKRGLAGTWHNRVCHVVSGFHIGLVCKI